MFSDAHHTWISRETSRYDQYLIRGSFHFSFHAYNRFLKLSEFQRHQEWTKCLLIVYVGGLVALITIIIGKFTRHWCAFVLAQDMCARYLPLLVYFVLTLQWIGGRKTLYDYECKYVELELVVITSEWWNFCCLLVNNKTARAVPFIFSGPHLKLESWKILPRPILLAKIYSCIDVICLRERKERELFVVY